MDPGMAIFARTITVISFAILSVSAGAQETASVLPKSIFRGRIVSVFAPNVSEQFNDQGEKESLASAFDGKEVKFSAYAPPALQAAVAGLPGGLNTTLPQLLDASYQVSAKYNVQQYVTALEYGISSRFSIGVIVPVVHIQAQASLSSENGHDQARAILENPALASLKPYIDAYLQKSTLDGLGYQTPTDFSMTGVGDIEVGGKYQFYKSDDLAMALQAGVRLPTASHRPDQRNLFDLGSGDGQTDVAVQWMGDYHLNSNLYFGGSTRLTWQLADTEDRHIRRYSWELLPDLNDDSRRDSYLRRDLGETLDAEVSVNYEFSNDQFKVWTAYQYQLQAQDSYSGTKRLDYASLEKNTNSILNRYTLGFGYTTIPAFRRKKIAVPMDLKISYSAPFASQNVTNSKYGRFDLLVYF